MMLLRASVPSNATCICWCYYLWSFNISCEQDLSNKAYIISLFCENSDCCLVLFLFFSYWVGQRETNGRCGVHKKYVSCFLAMFLVWYSSSTIAWVEFFMAVLDFLLYWLSIYCVHGERKHSFCPFSRAWHFGWEVNSWNLAVLLIHMYHISFLY